VHETGDADATVPASHNSVTGRIFDASFIGVSTQYVVDIPGDQQLTVFSQNTGTSLLRPGTDVVLHWDASHTFALDGSEDLRSGLDDSEAE
jgi:spermidine/putrescine transport system ATP-binding protein